MILYYLMTTHDSCLGAIIIVEQTLNISTLAIWAPNGFLGIVRLQHVGPLHFHGNDKVGTWIRVGLPGLS